MMLTCYLRTSSVLSKRFGTEDERHVYQRLFITLFKLITDTYQKDLKESWKDF